MISDTFLRRVLRSDRRVAIYGDLIRAAVAFAVVIVVAVWLLYYAAIVRFMFVKLHMNDFGKFYYSAQLFLAGEDMYGPSPATEIPVGDEETRQFWNMNPPHFHLIILPLARLSPGAALAVWTVMNLVALVACLRLITGELAVRWTMAGTLWLTFAVILSAATGTILITGQLTFLLALPITIGWIQARRGNWNAAAVLLGIAASVKPFLGIFALYLLVTGKFGPLVRMIAAIAACVLIGLVVFGTSSYAAWIDALSAVAWPWAGMNASISGMVARLLADSPFYTPVVYAPALVKPLSMLVSVLLGAVSLWLVARDDSAESTDRAFVGLLLAALLVSPLGWIYYLWLPAGAAFALWRSRRTRPSRLRGWLIALAIPGLICQPAFMFFQSKAWWMGLTLGSAFAWSTLLLWAAFVADWFVRSRKNPARRREPAGPEDL